MQEEHCSSGRVPAKRTTGRAPVQHVTVRQRCIEVYSIHVTVGLCSFEVDKSVQKEFL
jgi:hypothetical protein